MSPRVFAPIPLAIALLLGVVLPVPQACAAQVEQQKQGTRQFVLSTGIVDGKMVFLDAQGKPLTTLNVDQGDTVEIRISSGEGARHDFVIPELKIHSQHFDASTGATSVKFKATKAGNFTYVCTVPGHKQMGMEGQFIVAAKAGAKTAEAVKVPAAAVVPVVQTAKRKEGTIAPAAADAVSIARDPNEVPPALAHRVPQTVKYRIETVELNGKLDDGTTFNYWTFDKKVPGKMLRVRVGDTIELTLVNPKSSKNIHSIDLHAATGGLGGGADTQVPPGQEKAFRFKALNPGLYVYHCATASVPHHISAGMYGLILVEPEGGLPPVDKEFYVMQGDLYTNFPAGTKGHHEYAEQRANDEIPSFYTFNGAVGSLTKEFKMSAEVGETVRVYFGVGGPNKTSSFHVIGEIFDTVYNQGSISSPNKDVQTTLVAPGGATIVDFKVNVPGKFLLVDHALSRVGKGLVGQLEVAGPRDESIYFPMSGAPNMADMSH